MTEVEHVIRVAHIVHPASKMRDVQTGKQGKAKSLCGTFVTRSPSVNAPICRGCFDRYIEIGEPPDIEAAEQKIETTV